MRALLCTILVACSPLVAQAAGPTSLLNDTGITASQCYQAGSDSLVACSSAGAMALNNAQDGMTGRDADTASNSGADGKLGFSFSAVAGGCVQDNVTGLMWEVKTTDGGLRDWNNTYTNYSDNRAGDASAYPTVVNATNLCGYNDWRLPTADELQSIVDYGAAYPGSSIDATLFPNTQGNVFWSASPFAGGSDYTWGFNFHDGLSYYYYPRSNTYYLRLVRAGQPQISPRYTVSADGQEVADSQTNLIWRRCAEGMNWDGSTCVGAVSSFTHDATLQRAAAQAVSSGKAWRLPNVKELSSIADRSRINPAIDPTAFPATPATSADWFWSASPYVDSPIYAWYVSFFNGEAAYQSRSYSYAMRLVRSGQSFDALNPPSGGYFTDNFDGSQLQSAYWTSTGITTVSGGSMSFGCGASASTAGKFTVSGNQIIIESKFAGTGSARDTHIELVDASNGDRIQFGDTTYSATATPGLYVYGTGAFNLGQAGNGTSVSGYKEYRMTITGAAYSFERGDTLASITESKVGTLGGSIAGKTFYLNLGTGGAAGPYCPGSFDWIRVNPSAISTVALAITGSGAGAGTVTSGENPVHINCPISAGATSGTFCSSNETSGTTVTLTATAASGSSFTGWSGCDSQTTDTPAKCIVNMNAAKSVGVEFSASSINYTKIANNGSVLPDNAQLGSGATDWACTRDNNTGLVWEVKTTDGGLRDMNNTYTNFDDPTQIQRWLSLVNTTQAEIDATSNSIGFVNAVNSSVLCGSHEWRMPSEAELSGLLDMTYTPRIHPTFFPNTSSLYFWSGSSYASYPYDAWFVGFGDSYPNLGADRYYRYQYYGVRLAHSEPSFVLSVVGSGSGTGTVTSGETQAHISCPISAGATSGTFCSSNETASTVVTLTAVAAPGSTFTGWSGCPNATGTSCVVTMDAAKSVGAGFSGTPPGAPAILPNIVAGASGAQVAFTAPVDTGSGAITSYEASCQHGSDTPLSSVGASSPITVPGLQRGLIYSCKVRAQNAAGWGAAYSDTAQALWSNDAALSWAVKMLSETRVLANVQYADAAPGENNWGPFEWAPGTTSDSVQMDGSTSTVGINPRWRMDGSVLGSLTVPNDGEQFGGVFNHRLVLCTWRANNNGGGSANCTYPDVPTHLLYSPEDATPGNFGEPIATNKGLALDTRTPVILVHGWQGSPGGYVYNRNASIGPASQLDPEAVGNDKTVRAEGYWANLLAFFNLPELKAKYKVWVYKYPSYKHVTFNARQLGALINSVPELQGRSDLVFIAHSMGTIVTRSLFEEHGLDFPESRAAKLVMLEGVHHGSPAAIPGFVSADNLAKNLATLGANDIQWDFYDGLNIENRLDVGGQSVASRVLSNMSGNPDIDLPGITELPTYQKLKDALTGGQYSGSVDFGNGSAPLSGTVPVNTWTYAKPQVGADGYENFAYTDGAVRLGETLDFDTYFRAEIDQFSGATLPVLSMAKQCTTLGSVTNVGKSVVISTYHPQSSLLLFRPVLMNPWLLHLNLLYQKMANTYKNKVYAYSGIYFGSGADGDLDSQANLASSSDTFALAAKGVQALGSLGGLVPPGTPQYGYFNDGPVPTSSALLDSSHSFADLINARPAAGVSLLSKDMVAGMYPKLISDAYTGIDTMGVARINPGDARYDGDGYIKHRLLGDYNHDMALNGCYPTSDDGNIVASRLGWTLQLGGSCWRRNQYNDQNSDRLAYAQQALGALPLSGIDADKLKWEPLYLSILRDIAPAEPAIPWISGLGFFPSITVSPSKLDFGAIKISSQADLTMTIRNGDVPSTVTPTIAGPFSVTSNTCTGTLAASATCTVTLRYQPTVAGSSIGLLRFGLNSGSEESSVTVSATGIGMPSGSKNMSLPSKTGAGAVTLGIGTDSGGNTSSCELDTFRSVKLNDPLVTMVGTMVGTVPAAAPAPSVHFPYALVEFKLTNCSLGVSQKMTLTLPDALPAGVNWAYWKALPSSWLQFNGTNHLPVEISADRKVITFTVTDGGAGDLDGVANGTIVDPSGLGVIDVTPDTFTFTPVTGVALGSTMVSNVIGVSGIDAAVPISVTGGEYSVSVDGGTNWSAYSTGSPATVDVNTLVRVRHVASALPVSSVTTTLTLGGVSASFVSTTVDTIPDAFSFTAQIGAALNSVAVSNTLTVAGINSASAIGIVGGTYSINGGVYTAVAGTVNNGDTVTVKQTSSGSYSTPTTATLTIGGVSGAFNVTTLAVPAVAKSYTAFTTTGSITATFTGGGAGCGFTHAQFVPVSSVATPPPAGVSFPQGLFDFITGGCTSGSTLTFTITYPQALPPGTVYWKYGPTASDHSDHWYQLPAVIAGNTATFSIQDGGLGDDDYTANGSIADGGGPGGGAAGIPMLSEWVLLALAGLMGLLGMGALRRRRAQGI